MKMGGVMAAGGLVGTVFGVWLFTVMRRYGQMDLLVSASYVILLGTVGGLMLNESLKALRASRGGAAPARRVQHGWMHRLPFKMRFRESRLYISVIPPVLIGFGVGILSAIMGVGGGFVIVPAMIYLLRMPTNVVMGTSLFQIIIVTSAVTVLQATTNFSVDIMLAFFLILGGVVGAQFGVRIGARLRGEQLRLLLALLVLAVAIRLFLGLVLSPDDPFSVTTVLP
jgi:uncharacterized membrane protein YfcA